MLKPKKYLILGEKYTGQHCALYTSHIVHCSNCTPCIVQIAFCLWRGRGKSFVGLGKISGHQRALRFAELAVLIPPEHRSSKKSEEINCRFLNYRFLDGE